MGPASRCMRITGPTRVDSMACSRIPARFEHFNTTGLYPGTGTITLYRQRKVELQTSLRKTTINSSARSQISVQWH